MYLWIRDNFIYIILAGIVAFVLQTIIVANDHEGRHYHMKIINITAAGIYFVALCYVTLGCRHPEIECNYNFTVFWSWREVIWAGDVELFWLNIANILSFLPLGMFLQDFFGRQMTWRRAAGIGLGISICIEVAQLIWKLGLFEFDDMIHNTLGTLLGFALAKGIKGAAGVK